MISDELIKMDAAVIHGVQSNFSQELFDKKQALNDVSIVLLDQLVFAANGVYCFARAMGPWWLAWNKK